MFHGYLIEGNTVLRTLPIASTGTPITPRIGESVVEDGKVYLVTDVFWKYGDSDGPSSECAVEVHIS